MTHEMTASYTSLVVDLEMLYTKFELFCSLLLLDRDLQNMLGKS